MKSEQFSITNPQLEINVNCDIALLESNSGQVRVEATGSKELLDELEIRQSGGTVIIKTADNNSGGSVFIGNVYQSNVVGGNTVVQRNGTTYINTGGAVYVNGKRVDQNKSSDRVTELYEPLQIKVYLPQNVDSDINLSGLGSLAATVGLGDVSLNCAGSSKFAIAHCQDLDIDVSGTATGKIKHVSGALSIDCSGMANIEVTGEFPSVRVNGSGSATINTFGFCKGDYKVNGSGMLKLNHLGTIGGRVKRNLSGMCTVNV